MSLRGFSAMRNRFYLYIPTLEANVSRFTPCAGPLRRWSGPCAPGQRAMMLAHRPDPEVHAVESGLGELELVVSLGEHLAEARGAGGGPQDYGEDRGRAREGALRAGGLGRGVMLEALLLLASHKTARDTEGWIDWLGGGARE